MCVCVCLFIERGGLTYWFLSAVALIRESGRVFADDDGGGKGLGAAVARVLAARFGASGRLEGGGTGADAGAGAGAGDAGSMPALLSWSSNVSGFWTGGVGAGGGGANAGAGGGGVGTTKPALLRSSRRARGSRGAVVGAAGTAIGGGGGGVDRVWAASSVARAPLPRSASIDTDGFTDAGAGRLAGCVWP